METGTPAKITRAHKLFAAGLIALLAFAQPEPLFAQKATKIQGAQILELLKSLDSEILNKDAKGVCTNFAEDAIITIVLYEGGEKYTATYDKKKYQATLEATLANSDGYTAKRSGTQVQVATDGKTATAESTSVEEFRGNGIRKAGTTKRSYSFVLRGGRILIKTMSNVSKVQ